MSLRRELVDTIVHGISLARIPSILRHFRKDEFSILMLHGLTRDRHHPGIGNTEELHIHVDDFEEICDLLARNYRVISLDEALDRIAKQEPCPGGAVILTFDDGYRSNYELAFPLLRKYGLHGTIFVATGFVHHRAWQWWDRLEYALGFTDREAVRLTLGATNVFLPLGSLPERKHAFLSLVPVIKALPQETVSEHLARIEDHLGLSLEASSSPPAIYLPATWDQLREMHRSPHVTIGAHTHTHRILGRCQEETVRWELTTCRDLLDRELGITSPLFAYPNGQPGDHTEATKAIVRELGFRCALTTETGTNRAPADPYTLRRYSTGNHRRYVDVTVSGAMEMLLTVNDAIRFRRRAA